MAVTKSKNQRRKYKALILDVDGTIIPNKIDGRPSKKIVEYILKANKILHVGIATSRPYAILSPIVKILKLSGPSIIHSGARVVDISSQEVLWERPIERKSILKIVNIFKKYNLPFTFNDNGKDSNLSNYRNLEKPLCVWTLKASPMTANLLIKDISKIPNIAAHKIPSWVKGHVTINIGHSLATKKHAIQELAKLLNIQTSEIIGVGDGHNDLPLLLACGLKIAMGNAVNELKAIADYVGPSVEDDGVANIISKFIL